MGALALAILTLIGPYAFPILGIVLVIFIPHTFFQAINWLHESNEQGMWLKNFYESIPKMSYPNIISIVCAVSQILSPIFIGSWCISMFIYVGEGSVSDSGTLDYLLYNYLETLHEVGESVRQFVFGF